jgi:hypothetical protein
VLSLLKIDDLIELGVHNNDINIILENIKTLFNNNLINDNLNTKNCNLEDNVNNKFNVVFDDNEFNIIEKNYLEFERKYENFNKEEKYE